MNRLNDPFAPTPEGFHLRVEQTLSGLKEREPARRRTPVRLVVAVAVLLTAATLAASAIVSGGYMGWDGVFHSYEENPGVEPPEYGDPNYKSDPVYESVPVGEYWRTDLNGEAQSGLLRSFEFIDPDELAAAVDGSGLPLATAPSGWYIDSFRIQTEPEAEPYSEYVRADGSVLRKYKLTPVVPGKIDNYTCYFSNNKGGWFMADVSRVPASDHLVTDWKVHLSGSGEYSAEQVDGFDRAVYIDDGDGTRQLILLKLLGEECIYVHIDAGAGVSKSAMLAVFMPDIAVEEEASSGMPEIWETETRLAHELLDEIPDGQYWCVNCTYPVGKVISSVTYPRFDTLDDLSAALAEAGMTFPLPAVPEGFAAGDLRLLLRPESDPYKSVALETGAVFEKYYLLPAISPAIEGCSGELKNEAGDRISFEISLESGAMLPRIFTRGEAVEVKGFDRACLLSQNSEGEVWHTLTLLRARGDGWLRVDVHAPAVIPIETLLSLF